MPLLRFTTGFVRGFVNGVCRQRILLLVLPVGLWLSGCASRLPFAGAERGACYTAAQFEELLVAEKLAYLDNELRTLQGPDPVAEDIVALRPFMVRKYPTLAEWRKLKAKIQPGDLICEFQHRLHGAYYDGPSEAEQRGYALIRNNRIVAFVRVDGQFNADF